MIHFDENSQVIGRFLVLCCNVLDEPEMLTVGPLALYTVNIKTALEAEAKAWILLFAKYMNEKYEKMMTKLLKMMEDWAAQLARPIKDLDDIRVTMSCLKIIRENEINIDMEISPIEVWTFVILDTLIFLL